jgi:hypothetical protein
MWATLGMAVSASVIAGAIYDYATGNHLRALIMGAVGLVGFLVAYLFSKRRPEAAHPPLMNNSGNASATGGNASIGDIVINVPLATPPAPALEAEHAYREVLTFLERTMVRGRAIKYFVETIAAETGLRERWVYEALERLVREGHVLRLEIQGVGIDGSSTRWDAAYCYAHY